jgi:hypothetical protein
MVKYNRATIADPSLQMYPHPPQSRHPTNYFWILIVCAVAMLIVFFVVLRTVATRLNAAIESGPITLIQLSPAPRISLAPQANAASSPGPSEQASPISSTVFDVDAKALTESPATYRSRIVRVQGTVFYTGKLADGKTWVQIVGDDNTYVDGQADSLPAGVGKGSKVRVTGLGAGLTNITASNGKDYDQAYIDPIQTIEAVGG